MAMLQIRDLDDEVRRALDRRARANHRSASAEAAVLLAEAVGTGDDARQRRRQLLEDIARRAEVWPTALPCVEDLLAEDRGR